MSEILSDSQEQEIRVTLPSSVTIIDSVCSTTHAIAKKWATQEIDSNITITLNISLDSIDTGIEDVTDGVLYYGCNLTIHILVDTVSGSFIHHGAHIAKAIAQTIVNTIKNWTTPLSNDIRIFDPTEDIKTLSLFSYDAGIFDYILYAKLYHS